MYHTSIENQVFQIKKSFLTTNFPSKDLQTSYSGNIDSYINTLTPFEQDIAHLFLKFRKAPFIKHVNSSIAKKVGCSVRTVIRATNKFHKDGFITKKQPHQYATNNYTLDEKIKKGSHAFSHWFNSLTSSNQDLYISHGIIIDHKNKIICSDVTPNNSSLILDSLSRRLDPVLTRAREKRHVFLKKPKRKIMNSVQKQLILDNRSDPNIKEILKRPEISSEIITPSIKKIARLLTLDEKEQFKLVAFDEDALQYALERIEPVVIGNKALSTPVRNKLEWTISFATEFCKKNNSEPDWHWYYELCKITGMSTQTDPKPLVSEKKVTKASKSSMYLPWKAPKQPPIEEQIKILKKDIQSLSEQINSIQTTQYMIAYATNVVRGKINELKLLEAHHDITSISH